MRLPWQRQDEEPTDWIAEREAQEQRDKATPRRLRLPAINRRLFEKKPRPMDIYDIAEAADAAVDRRLPELAALLQSVYAVNERVDELEQKLSGAVGVDLRRKTP